MSHFRQSLASLYNSPTLPWPTVTHTLTHIHMPYKNGPPCTDRAVPAEKGCTNISLQKIQTIFSSFKISNMLDIFNRLFREGSVIVIRMLCGMFFIGFTLGSWLHIPMTVESMGISELAHLGSSCWASWLIFKRRATWYWSSRGRVELWWGVWS